MTAVEALAFLRALRAREGRFPGQYGGFYERHPDDNLTQRPPTCDARHEEGHSDASSKS